MRVEERIAPYAVQANLLVPLGEVCKTTSGGTPSRKNPDYFSGPIPWVKSGELPDGPVVEIEESISEEALRQSSAKLFPAGTLLMALYGATVGKLGVLTRPAATNQAVCAIFPPPDLDTKFLFWFLRFKRSELIAQAVGGAQPNISQGIVRDLKIPLLPLDQQKRIVAEIEKQFSRLDEAVANLKRVKANLKRYKAAVLKAAVEGRLVETEAELARREGRSYETGAQLLQRILETRRSQWQGKGKYKEPIAPDTNDLPELPDGWVWASLEQACLKITDGTHHSPKNYSQGEYRYITSKNVREFRLALEDITFVDKATHDEIYSRCDVRKDDVLYVKDGVNTGLAAKNTLDEQFSLLSSVGVFRTVPLLSPDYLVAYLNSTGVRDRMLANIAGVAITRLTLSKLKVTVIAVPPPIEQQRIFAEVDRHLTLLRATETQMEANLQRAQVLRQSVLSKAFTGTSIEN
jgi:type I restriction enzyme, S subunit